MTGPQSYAFTVGRFRCAVVSDGTAPVDMDRIAGRFPDVPRDALRAASEALGFDPDNFSSAYNVLVVRAGDDDWEGTETILFDTGSGVDARPVSRWHLLTSLAEVGVRPEDVTIVVITHAHGDHINGVLTDGTPTFPNARYVISQPEWDHWTTLAESETERFAGLTATFEAMEAAGLTKLTPGDEIVSGIVSVPLPGHTPGQIGARISDDGDELLHLIDALHAPFQLPHPAWSIKFDTDPAQAATTRREALQMADEGNTFTLFYHLGFPGLGRVLAEGDAFRWQPIMVGD
ncbi:MAG: MBL fold metallo-hydrolase [Chloroflexota bacterium]